MARTQHFVEGSGWNPPTTDMRSPAYADYHRAYFAHVPAAQRAAQVAAAKGHIDTASALRQAGDRPGAARALKRAANERSIAARMTKK